MESPTVAAQRMTSSARRRRFSMAVPVAAAGPSPSAAPHRRRRFSMAPAAAPAVQQVLGSLQEAALAAQAAVSDDAARPPRRRRPSLASTGRDSTVASPRVRRPSLSAPPAVNLEALKAQWMMEQAQLRHDEEAAQDEAHRLELDAMHEEVLAAQRAAKAQRDDAAKEKRKLQASFNARELQLKAEQAEADAQAQAELEHMEDEIERAQAEADEVRRHAEEQLQAANAAIDEEQKAQAEKTMRKWKQSWLGWYVATWKSFTVRSLKAKHEEELAEQLRLAGARLREQMEARLQGRIQANGWEKWTARVAFIVRTRNLKHRIMTRIQHRSIATGWAQWTTHVVTLIRSRRTLLGFKRKWIAGSYASSWDKWCRFVDARSALRATIARCARKRNRVAAARAIRALAAHATTAHYEDRIAHVEVNAAHALATRGLLHRLYARADRHARSVVCARGWRAWVTRTSAAIDGTRALGRWHRGVRAKHWAQWRAFCKRRWDLRAILTAASKAKRRRELRAAMELFAPERFEDFALGSFRIVTRRATAARRRETALHCFVAWRTRHDDRARKCAVLARCLSKRRGNGLARWKAAAYRAAFNAMRAQPMLARIAAVRQARYDEQMESAWRGLVVDAVLAHPLIQSASPHAPPQPAPASTPPAQQRSPLRSFLRPRHALESAAGDLGLQAVRGAARGSPGASHRLETAEGEVGLPFLGENGYVTYAQTRQKELRRSASHLLGYLGESYESDANGRGRNVSERAAAVAPGDEGGSGYFSLPPKRAARVLKILGSHAHTTHRPWRQVVPRSEN